jgi:hypothetical protein
MEDRGKRPSRLRALLASLRRLLRREKEPPQAPGDPYAYRMAPVRRGPKGRSGAAIAEPEDDSYRDYTPRRQ